MNIALPSPVSVVLMPESKIDVSEIIVTAYREQLSERKVFAILQGNIPILLWEGDAYDAIGQWTDGDVLARIMELATPENVQKWFGHHA